VQQAAPTQIIKIEPTQPEVIYVPSYNPTVVYGGWAYPSYPPAPYYPPGYAASNMMSFGVGVACGAAWGYAWGNSNWGHNDVDIDVNRNTNINNNINRSNYQNQINANRQNVQGAGQRGQGSWQHNPQHRQGVPYRDQNTAQRYGGAQSGQAAQARDSYRGRADAGRSDLARNPAGAGAAAGNRPTAQPRNNAAGGAGGAGGAGAGAAGGSGWNTGQRSPAGASGTRGSSFEGVDRGGASANAASQRGQTSRANSPSASSRSGSSGSRSGASAGGSRGGGGGSRDYQCLDLGQRYARFPVAGKPRSDPGRLG
jgi:hypothetical protein